MNKEIFKDIANKNKVKPNYYKNGFFAFLGGGLLGLLAQGLIDLYNKVFNLSMDLSIPLSCATIVLLAAILTFTTIYNDLGQIFGAGLFIPITGFSNSMVSSAIEGKPEGLIFGIGSRIFSLAGSVICYGVLSSFIFCLIYFIFNVCGVNVWIY